MRRSYSNNKTSLRKRAEAFLDKNQTTLKGTSIKDTKELVHELHVHQIELEIQNEELKRSQYELAESRDNYSDLYDFAPIGYVVLNEKNIIVEANLTICSMLLI